MRKLKISNLILIIIFVLASCDIVTPAPQPTLGGLPVSQVTLPAPPQSSSPVPGQPPVSSPEAFPTTTALQPGSEVTNPAASSPTEAPIPPGQAKSTAQILAEMGGTTCNEFGRFTCIKLAVNLDHSHPQPGQTTEVTFAVLPAAVQSKGFFVNLTGGPG